MKIYSRDPEDWKQLQYLTSKFLSEIGYKCEIEKDVCSIRGKVNIDVYAENIRKAPASIILCECKYWESAIPQAIIHSFRTVVADIGANYGFIISKIGFQKGSIDSSKSTNISLFTWEEFLEYFRENWIKTMTRKISTINHDLLTYVGAGFPVFFKTEYQNLTKEKLSEYEKLTYKYFNTAFYSMQHNYEDLDSREFHVKYFEAHISKAKYEFGVEFISYEDFYTFLINDAQKGIHEFDKLFNQKLRKGN